MFAEVWTTVRDASSVRSVVKELRAILRAAGMANLADAIDGHVAHHYAIILNRLYLAFPQPSARANHRIESECLSEGL